MLMHLKFVIWGRFSAPAQAKNSFLLICPLKKQVNPSIQKWRTTEESTPPYSTKRQNPPLPLTTRSYKGHDPQATAHRSCPYKKSKK